MITNLELEGLRESDAGRMLSDGSGVFGAVRVEPSPSRRVVVDFMLRAAEAGQPCDMALGTWPDHSLAQIRLAAGTVRPQPAPPPRPRILLVPPQSVATASRALSTPPAASTTSVPARPDVLARGAWNGSVPTVPAPPARFEAPTAPAVSEAGRLTVTEAFERWRIDALAGRKDGGESVRRSMLKDVLPYIGELPIASVERDSVAEVLDRIVQRGSARQAGCVLADVRQMFRWAVQAGLTPTDPTVTLRKTDFGGEPQARQRRLSDLEVAELAARMRAARLARHVRHAIWLMLATGTRIGEIATARWTDIDLQAGHWTIPAEWSHSGRPHAVPLSDFAIRHLCPEGEARRSDTWVFPGRHADEPLSPKALGKQIRDRQRGSQIRGRASGTTTLLLSGGEWTPLDLRRTASTMLVELGVRADVIGACLDQAVRSDGLRGASRAPTMEERQDAMQRLGRKLEVLERSAQAETRRAA